MSATGSSIGMLHAHGDQEVSDSDSDSHADEDSDSSKEYDKVDGYRSALVDK